MTNPFGSVEEARRLWVEALRSGQYEQGQENLKCLISNYGEPEYSEYCCLGVAAEIVVARTGEDFDSLRHEDKEYLKEDVAEIFDLTFAQQERLGQWNDGDLYSFDDIAESIEQDDIPPVETVNPI